MTKNIAEMIEPQPACSDELQHALQTATAAIPSPRSYFSGRCRGSCPTPESILLFTRTDGQDLNNHPHRHFHHRHLLLLPLRGNGRLIVDEEAHSLRPGLALLIRPYQFHHYSGIDTESILWLFITFETDIVYPPQPSLCTVENSQVWNDVLRLLETYNEPQNAATDRALALRLALILENLQRLTRQRQPSHATHDARDAEQLVLKLRSILLANLSHALSITDLARQIGLSPSRLRARFRQSTGYSIGRFQRTIRMQHAAQLLARNQLSVCETAAACGWDSSFSFSRAFKQYWGRPPKTFQGTRQPASR